MNRTTLSLIAGVTALAAVTGFAALSAPDAPGADAPGADATAKAAAQRTRGAYEPAVPGPEHVRPRRDVLHVLHARHEGHGKRRQGRTPGSGRGVGGRLGPGR